MHCFRSVLSFKPNYKFPLNEVLQCAKRNNRLHDKCVAPFFLQYDDAGDMTERPAPGANHPIGGTTITAAMTFGYRGHDVALWDYLDI